MAAARRLEWLRRQVLDAHAARRFADRKRRLRCPSMGQRISSAASVTGGVFGRTRSRAHTAGLVVQRAPAASLCASVTGGDPARAPVAPSRAHTAGLVVQRGRSARATVGRVSASARAVSAGRATRAGAGARFFCCADRRAQTMGLLVQRGAAALSPGTSQTPAPSRTPGSTSRSKRRAGAGIVRTRRVATGSEAARRDRESRIGVSPFGLMWIFTSAVVISRIGDTGGECRVVPRAAEIVQPPFNLGRGRVLGYGQSCPMRRRTVTH
jgi:hypothetical protein